MYGETPNLRFFVKNTMETFTQNRIEELKANPYVIGVGPTHVLLTAECVQLIYAQYVMDPTISGIEDALRKLGFTLTGKNYILPKSLFIRFMEPLSDREMELVYWASESTAPESNQEEKQEQDKDKDGKSEENTAEGKAASGNSTAENKATAKGATDPQNDGTFDSEEEGNEAEAEPKENASEDRERCDSRKNTSENDEAVQKSSAPNKAESNTEEIGKLTDEELISTGKFVRSYSGVSLSPAVERQVIANFPETTIEEILERNGLSVAQVGINRVYRLNAKYKKLEGRDPMLYKDPLTYSTYTDKVLQVYGDHPYVERCDKGSITLNERFMDEAQRIDLPIHTLLRTFCIDPGLFSYEERTELVRKLKEHPPAPIREPGFDELMGCTPIMEQVYCNRLWALEKTLEKTLAACRERLPGMSLSAKKELFKAIEAMPKDPSGKYTLSGILDALGISRTTYYGVIGNETYGEAALAKEEQDLMDVEVIRKVMDYKGFRKGSRQIYMQMEALEGVQFGLQKIRRLMKKFGLHSGIREPNEEKRRMKAYIKGQVKPNLLKRRFRLYRPNEVRLTDVTYLSYGPEGKRAYCSASIDPVTGKLAAINVSQHNDLDLVMETLRILKEDPLVDGVLLHSDRGCLYLTRDFQKEVEKNGFLQSMSKLGNCWDNAPEESVNGTIKQEMVLSMYNSFEELRKGIDEYAEYYNAERHIFSRKKMTPLQYEDYLLSMNEEEWQAYLEKEEERYDDMKENSKKKAKARAKELGT